ncbi:unnamed protein product [Leptosia nina]|uniref:Gustatory receptor n=1 Tax=Leptosia nina TaxID=320188 RepID=A0AAV1K1V0_9NEOP
MSKPAVLVNTFVREKPLGYCVDPVSKFFIIVETLLGLNRLLLVGKLKTVCVLLGYGYSALMVVLFNYMTFDYDLWEKFPVATTIDIMSFLLCVVISSVLWKRVRNYYIELSLFDAEVMCEVKLSRRSIGNLVQSLLSLMCLLGFFLISFTVPNSLAWLGAIVMPMKVLHTVDFHFTGHLLSLLVPRLQLINYFLEDLYPQDEICKRCRLDKAIKINTRQKREISMIVDYYNRIIKAYDILNDAIKWQLNVDGILLMLNILTVRFVPMLLVCVTGDNLQKEVLHLQELLACRLYEGRLDNRDRRPAQALLTLTEARNLSFSLFHMFNIDISLPFKMFSLLITYLIILLQFEKVNRTS